MKQRERWNAESHKGAAKKGRQNAEYVDAY